MLTLDPTPATMVLLAGAGWQNVQQGSLVLDELQLAPPSPTEVAEDYGFAYVADTGERVTGRLSALLAISVWPGR